MYVWKKNHCVNPVLSQRGHMHFNILFSWQNLQLTLKVSIFPALRNSFVSKNQSSITMQKHSLNEGDILGAKVCLSSVAYDAIVKKDLVKIIGLKVAKSDLIIIASHFPVW